MNSGITRKLFLAIFATGLITMMATALVVRAAAGGQSWLRGDNLVYLALLGMAALGAVALRLAQRLLVPVTPLLEATHRMAMGDYSARAPTAGADELARLAADLNRLADTLSHNDRLRRDLLADISHELRTPLSVMRGEIEAMEDGVRPLTQDALASLRVEISLLSKLIDDLYELSLSDIGALTYQFAPVDMTERVATAVTAFGDWFEAKGIALNVHLPNDTLVIEGDLHRLTQLLGNLFENSLRYTDAGGAVRVYLSSTDKHLRLEIEDSAPGVPDHALPRLFERLFRVEASRSRRSGGAGLGLALCKHIVEAHGGRIVARHSPLGGLALAITLPYSGCATGDAAAPRHSPAHCAGAAAFGAHAPGALC
ncbi:HAMP domain-containing protein [Pandoraea nosoerga]|uniref:histidine kinase n=1 Tax=Pandoraea nosoerga TaxID=2508296 RepID=A0A5E4XYZ0_9BURK|nr:ATP-binding protein [Pandoraea nosoerga]MBN4664774.1 HAMP domain-containing protein [Pandoraea nosoerga]MBN4674052.1 HAMP domain-containing protein [Pandoraea nosoerga]MBN4680014.1 HAMP domain-containing protein [Pandoraea nosoerga]MBN4744271.1 HAMP domain-containing protein [Pandoraea nosoerga]VVE41497.1 signal transduction histidine-protein kinase BaeS [Pandoraea nosoerga]